jgi:hypothetical protein
MPLLPRATVAMTALRLTLLIPVLFALVPLPALAEMPGWWREGAVWAGDGVQADGQRWSVEIALGVDDARISYPSIPCSGTLEVLAATATTITLRETITVGRWAPDVRLARQGKRANGDGNPGATGVLTAQGPQPCTTQGRVGGIAHPTLALSGSRRTGLLRGRRSVPGWPGLPS